MYIPSPARGESFQYQNWFRTITIGFQPYIPFTQSYRMALKAGHLMHVQGRGTKGYFHYAPQDEGSEEQRELMSNYEWDVRRKTYFGEGSGKLTAMSVKPYNRGEKALSKSSELSGDTKEDSLGQGLSDFLDTEFGSPSHVYQQMGSRAHQEVMLRSIEEMAEAMVYANQPTISFTDRSRMAAGTPRAPIIRAGMEQRVGKSFDIFLEHTRSFGDFLEDISGHQLAADGILSLEVSRAQAGTGSSKVFTAFDTAQLTHDNAVDTWRAHLAPTINTMNAEIRREFEGVDAQTLLTMQEWDKWDLLLNTDSPRWKTETQLDKLAGSGWETTEIARYGSKQSMQQWHAHMRQNIDRMRADSYLGFRNQVDAMSHLWSAPLGPSTVGLALLVPDSTARTRAGSPVGAGGIPQIGPLDAAGEWTGYGIGGNSIIWTMWGLQGDIVEAYSRWMFDQGFVSTLQYANLTARAAVEASNISTATEGRVGALGSFLTTTVSQEILDGINMDVVVKRHLRPTQIAVELAKQLEDFYTSGAMKANLRNWYDQLMEESERLTTAWMDKMPENTQGTATLASEYVLGDFQGNPRKKYLGVWRDKMQQTWQTTGEGSKGDLGYNFSIAPFVTSRRVGGVDFG